MFVKRLDLPLPRERKTPPGNCIAELRSKIHTNAFLLATIIKYTSRKSGVSRKKTVFQRVIDPKSDLD